MTPLERLQAKVDKRNRDEDTGELAGLKRILAKCDGLYGYKDRCAMIRARIAELEADNG
jgi:hypothetical protein